MSLDSGQGHMSPVVLCAQQHKDYACLMNADYSLAKYNIVIPIGFQELPLIAKHYPILFVHSESIYPVAVLSVDGKTNAYIDDNGQWLRSAYIPLAFQLQPFWLEKLPDQDSGVLIFDGNTDRLTRKANENNVGRLFDTGGQPTQVLRQIAISSIQNYHGQIKAKEFARALSNAGILSPSLLNMNSGNNNVQRILTINEEAYRSLPESVINAWFHAGWLDAVSMVLLSLNTHWADSRTFTN